MNANDMMICYVQMNIRTLLCCGRNFSFEPKAKNTFPSFRIQRSIENFSFESFPYFLKHLSFLCSIMMILYMSKWMFMNANDMMICYVQMNIRTHAQKTISTALRPLKNEKHLPFFSYTTKHKKFFLRSFSSLLKRLSFLCGMTMILYMSK